MSDGDGRKSGKKNVLDRVSVRIRNFGQHLSTPNIRRRSRSLSPTPSSPSSKETSPAAVVTPGTSVQSTTNASSASGPPAPNHTLVSSTAASPTGAGPATPAASSATIGEPAATPPIPTTLPQTLSPLEIRQRTAELLKERLKSEEVEKIKWDETTPEQAKAVVQEVQNSLEGRPEHTGKMYKTLQYINKYATIVDVAIQHQPCITALVWAGIRTVIQVGDQPLFLSSYLSGITGYLYGHQSGECGGLRGQARFICLLPSHCSG